MNDARFCGFVKVIYAWPPDKQKLPIKIDSEVL